MARTDCVASASATSSEMFRSDEPWEMAITLTLFGAERPEDRRRDSRGAFHAFADRSHDGDRIQRRNLVEVTAGELELECRPQRPHDARSFRRVDDEADVVLR